MGCGELGFVEKDYRAAIDYPAAAYYAELLAANPDAKVTIQRLLFRCSVVGHMSTETAVLPIYCKT